MKKIALVLSVTGVVIAIVIGIVAYYGRQVTALPPWYTETPAPAAPRSSRDAAPRWTELPDTRPESGAKPGLGPGHDSQESPRGAPRQELRDFHRNKIGAHGDAVVGSRAIYDAGELEVGVVVDLERVDVDGATSTEHARSILERAVSLLSRGGDSKVYIGIEDHPTSTHGVLRLGEKPQLRVGELSYSIDEAASLLGLSQAELRRELDQQLKALAVPDPRAR